MFVKKLNFLRDFLRIIKADGRKHFELQETRAKLEAISGLSAS